MIPAQLTGACPEVRPATEADAVGGVRPQFVAEPASTEEAGALLRAAAGLGLAVVPRGGGTRLDWGVPPRRCDLVVDTRRLNRVLEHAAGDLVARVQAGVPLDRLSQVLGSAGQRLAVDAPAARAPGSSGAPGDPGPSGNSSAPGSSSTPQATQATDIPARPGRPGTVGGLIATGVAGPLRLRFGSPRDLLIGITLIRADGTIARAGGKVVKNVAGYDIGKLLAGSYGTLGLITEATFRLHPRPPAAAYVSLACPPGAAGQAASALLTAANSRLAPVAAELDWPGQDAPVTIAVALEGDADGVAERAALMHDLLAGAMNGRAAGNGGRAGRPAAAPAAMVTPDAGAPGAGSPDESTPGAGGPDVSTEPPPWWGHGPAAESEGTVLRIAFWAGQLAAVLTAIRAAAAETGLEPAVGGSAAAGVLHASLPDAAPADAVARFVTRLRAALASGPPASASPPAPAGPPASATPPGPAGQPAAPVPPGTPAPGGSVPPGTAGPPARGSVVVLTAPQQVQEAVDMWGPAPAVELMRAVKDQFDPEHRMSPGRFVGGI
ncbi:MAG TPA: FAD-binding oxidoreductase [Streptosporangiaceae bacterium]|nr:FAD-binding oxidoreductase [Streptosporangiaceae bacterium]